MNIAVITGASAGIGRELVYAVDKDARYDEIWVIARRKERLEELRDKCTNPIPPLPPALGRDPTYPPPYDIGYKSLWRSH